MKRLRLILFVVAVTAGLTSCRTADPTVSVGSKAFAESWILGEALTMLGRQAGDVPVEHKDDLGGTDVVYAALKRGDVDVYPEYTGTIAEAILKSPGRPSLEEMRRALAPQGLGISDSLGFNDGYALATTRATAARYGLKRISDLRRQRGLRLAFTHEFVERKDGWRGLARHYGLTGMTARGIQHDLAYEALRNGQIDVTEVYTTDTQIERLALVTLVDDRDFFPRYDAVLLYRLDLPRRAPGTFQAMQRLVGQITEPEMIRANALVMIEKQTQEQAATALLRDAVDIQVTAETGGRNIAREIAEDTLKHLQLVSISLLAAVLAGIPLGVLATRSRFLSAAVLSSAGVMQTIPSLALLAFLIPLLGIGEAPALLALFLYSLLPIVRNTYTGLTTIPPNLAEAADALGLPPLTQLRRVSLPMAAPAVMAGIKTSAVINVGTATLAALVGAGGLGDPILRGLQLLSTPLILQGAVPAAVLALLVQWGFDLLDRVVVPKGLRLPSQGQ